MHKSFGIEPFVVWMRYPISVVMSMHALFFVNCMHKMWRRQWLTASSLHWFDYYYVSEYWLFGARQMNCLHNGVAHIPFGMLNAPLYEITERYLHASALQRIQYCVYVPFRNGNSCMGKYHQYLYFTVVASTHTTTRIVNETIQLYYTRGFLVETSPQSFNVNVCVSHLVSRCTLDTINPCFTIEMSVFGLNFYISIHTDRLAVIFKLQFQFISLNALTHTFDIDDESNELVRSMGFV